MRSTASNIKPIGDKILVRKHDQKEGCQGSEWIIAPDMYKLDEYWGTVVAVGTGKTHKSGYVEPPPVKPGDVVHFSIKGSIEMKFDDDDAEYLWIKQDNVLCRLFEKI